MKKIKKLNLKYILLGTILLATAIPTSSLASRGIKVERYSGKSRYDTAVTSSIKTFDNSKYAIIASGENYPDALVGGTLATQLNAPVLLTSKNSIPSNVLSELDRLETEVVFLLGGDSTISNSVYKQFLDKGYKVERLAGRNRLDTAIKVREMRFKYADFITPGERVAVVDGTNFADSLSAAPFVGQMTTTTFLYPFVNGKTDKIPYYMAFGGKGSVPKGYAEKVRYSGKSRFDTSVEVAKAYESVLKKKVDTIILVDGNNYPDALSSAPLAKMNNGAILLTAKDALPKVVKDYITKNSNINRVIIVGGEGSVSSSVVNEIKNID